MGGMSKLALGTTITVALIFGLFLALFLVLLADFVSSLIRTRKQSVNQSVNRNRSIDLEAADPTKSPSLKTSSVEGHVSKPSTLPSFYAHGVLQAPTSFLLTVPKLEAAAAQPVNMVSSPVSVGSLSGSERFMCISNPVYDGVRINEDDGNNGTPFETPGTSPSHFGDEGEWSPPLGFMKKLPPVRLWHHGPVSATTDTNLASSCSFSSSTLCFSPSW